MTIAFDLNDRAVSVDAPPIRRLSDVLRLDLGLTGTKVGCEAGDCGACTVLLDGKQVCACMIPLGQVEGRHVLTVEGLAGHEQLHRLQCAFHECGAAQCGICTPGMLMAAADVLRRHPEPTAEQVKDGLGGVLCRCTGYQKVVQAVLSLAGDASPATTTMTRAVGARLPRVDGHAKVTGIELFGADFAPAGSLWLRVVRSPHARAAFRIGDVSSLLARHLGLARVLTAADVPGNNGFGIYPTVKDQPVLAESQVRYRGEAVLALVGDAEAIFAIHDCEIPIEWEVLEPVSSFEAALAPGAAPVQADKPDNVLVRGRVHKGDVESALASSAHTACGEWETSFVEHAYIEPEAGYARRVGERIELAVTTQTPYMDRDETAQVLGIEPEQVRILPTACGGGFGGKLDLSVQPLLALAAWITERPVRAIYTRPESMASTTKRHPARISACAGCDAAGHLLGLRFHADFNTGAYASWGPTVADRVPVHCTGPYRVPHVTATTRAVLTNAPPSGAFRGFGVPQSAVVHEALMDELAAKCAMDPLDFRLLNALRPGQATATGHVLQASVGMIQCLQAVRSRWQAWRATAEQFNRDASGARRRGVGVGCAWYGCGNTSMSNPSTMAVGVSRDGTVTLYNGAVDIGQGANTVMVQICADAIGIDPRRVQYVMGDTDRTADAGKSSASRQTFVSGRAAQIAGEDLRAQILRLTNAGAGSSIAIERGHVVVTDGGVTHRIDLEPLPEVAPGCVLRGQGTFDPPTSPLDENGQGRPYAAYGFACQIAEVEVDVELGTVKALRLLAAHDVGRAVNPTLAEGQIEGGVAQGLGFALMEEYIPGRTENLHDYLIPTFGDIPAIETILVEDPQPLGPYGAKGVGEHALIPTAPAILGAIEHAAGVRIHRLPATPDRVRAAIRNARAPSR